jgi:hypothetical protein
MGRNERAYSLTIPASQLEMVMKALTLAATSPRFTQTLPGAQRGAQALLQQLFVHIRNEKTLTDWEKED